MSFNKNCFPLIGLKNTIGVYLAKFSGQFRKAVFSSMFQIRLFTFNSHTLRQAIEIKVI